MDLLYFGIFAPLLPLVFFMLFKLKSREKTVRVILFYILYCVFNEAINYYLQKVGSSYFVYSLYAFTIIEYSFLCYFFFLVCSNKSTRKVIPYIWLLFILFTLFDYAFLTTGKDFDSLSIGIESVIIIFFCAYYLISQVREANTLVIYSTFNFWIVVTFLFYFCGTFFLYLFTDKMLKSPEFQKLYFIINISFNIMKNILLSIAMTMKSEKSVNYRSNKQDMFPDLGDDVLIHARN